MPLYKARFVSGAPSDKDSIALQQAGPLVPVQVEIPGPLAKQLMESGKPIPNPVTGRALIDTGATISGVHQPLLARLGVNPVGTTNIGTAGGQQLTGLYPIRMVLAAPMNLSIEYGEVIEVDLTGTDLRMFN